MLKHEVSTYEFGRPDAIWKRLDTLLVQGQDSWRYHQKKQGRREQRENTLFKKQGEIKILPTAFDHGAKDIVRLQRARNGRVYRRQRRV